MSDKILWQQLIEGNKNAFESIYRDNFSFLYNYGKKISKDTATVEDCIHDLFVDIWNRRGKLGETTSIRPYLLVSLRRKIIKTVATISKSTNDNEPTEYHFDTQLAIEDSIIEAEISEEKAKQLKAGMSMLSARQKEVLYLKYEANLDYKSIANTMNINYQSARNLGSQALKILAQKIKFWILIFLAFI